jgi:cell wall-associated NlpC family hydrolase
MSGDALARAAAALAGTRFRLHGRDPATGLDCIGLLAAALTAIGRPAPLPNGYALRSRALPGLDAVAAACGFTGAGAPLRPGDVLLARVGPCQHHLLIAAGAGFVHAHAGIGRVIASAGPPGWPIVHHWRLVEDIAWQP